MPSVPIDRRPLSESERRVLAHVLSMEFTGASELRSQLDQVEVIAQWSLESTSVDFQVRDATARSPQLAGVIPVNAHVLNEAGDYVGELLVWLDDGVLAGLEYAWVTDDMPTVLPDVEQIRLSPRR
jgi:hypothetical protein